MKSEFTLAFNEITERFGLSHETVMEALEAAMVSAYRRSVNASSAQAIQAIIGSDSGEVRIFAEKEVVDQVENPMTEVSLSGAQAADNDAGMGDMVLVDSTPEDFGRVAAQTAKQVILQRLREAERDAQYEEFIEREEDMVHGTVHSITPQAVTVGLGRAEAILPRNQQIPGERFHIRDRIRVYVIEVRKSSRGPVIVVSRTHPNMLRRLLEMEVPEIHQGLVEIRAIAREAGKRAKVAVSATRDGVDPVGACVGLRGVRIQSIVRDLNDEKIDVIEWNPDPSTFIAKALSPARVSGVFLDEDPEHGKTALVVVPEDQLSLAIGRAGVNARLAAKLTGWRIDIKSLIEAASESLSILSSDGFIEFAEAETESIPQVEAVLAKKQETRPVTPEEYQLITDFVNRVQSEVMARRDAVRQAFLEQLDEIRRNIPATAYDTAPAEVGLSTRVLNLLTEAGFETAGRLMEQLEIDEDKILKLQGIGPKAMQEMRDKLEAYPYPEAPAEDEEPVEQEIELVDEEEPVEQAEAVPAAPAEVAEQIAAEIVATEDIEEEVEEVVDLEAAFEQAAAEVSSVLAREEEVEVELDEAEIEREKRRRKERARIVEFDPELGEMVVKRRRKREGGEWGEDEGYEDIKS
jgi:N utilization substance protein A